MGADPTAELLAQGPLIAALEQSRAFGFLGPGPVEPQIRHAVAFAETVGQRACRVTALLDLGSGGGLPGLVLAALGVADSVVLLDANVRRCGFLREVAPTLKGRATISVVEGRAEEMARQPELRGAFDLVTARSFGPPAVTAECAAGFLSEGGWLVVSEPPASVDRWPEIPLRELGLVPLRRTEGEPAFSILEAIELCPARFPRRNGIPTKRPLF